MKNVKTPLFVLAAIIVACFVSCEKAPFKRVRGKGSNVTKVIDVSGFSKIDLDIDASISYTQDSIYRVEISAQQNIQEVLETYVAGSTLKISTEHSILRHNPIEIIVHSPIINGLSISGSGYIYTHSPINTTDMELTISGSGNVSIASLTAQSMRANISGSGRVAVFGGHLNNERIKISGSGAAQLFALETEMCTADISGSGEAEVWVTQKLDVTISGSGSVRYRGNPTVNSNISGSGKVVDAN